jgi:LmbE family N-acetylglucosaminyl deacetylase
MTRPRTTNEKPPADSGPLRLMIIGAHPDDAEYHAGGLAAFYAQAGHKVFMVSVTNGAAGHHKLRGLVLVERRRDEAAKAAAVIGAEHRVLEHPDGELEPTLEIRREIIGHIRTFQPDLLLTHRPIDYHPDHRYTSQLVQDAAYMVTVPAVVPNVPHLARDPIIAYLPDPFQKPYPFRADVAIDVGPVLDRILDMLNCHESQFYEWLPYNRGFLQEVPEEHAARRGWLAERVKSRLRCQADLCRDLLVRTYGDKRGKKVEFAEAFEMCEYGSPLDDAARERLFGFVC